MKALAVGVSNTSRWGVICQPKIAGQCVVSDVTKSAVC